MIDLEYAKRVLEEALAIDCSSDFEDAMGQNVADTVESMRGLLGNFIDYLDWDGKTVIQGSRVVGTLRRIDPPTQGLDLRLKDKLIHDAKTPNMLEYGKVSFPAADFYDENGKLRVDLDGIAAENESIVKGHFERACDEAFRVGKEEADAREARVATGLYDGNKRFNAKVHGLTCNLDEDCDCE